MNNQLFIPKKIKVGFQDRSDTYTKKLAYVIYYDAKGVLRKEKSWDGWRDKKIDPSEFDNSPTEGFVLNKKVGGYKSDWNHRATYSRVFDPRGFEFEISIPNLLFILQETDCTKGKGLIGEFVYAWDGTDLILLPVGSETYKKCVGYSELQGQKVGARGLIAGAVYETKKQKKLIYIGRYDWYLYEDKLDYSYYSRKKNPLTSETIHYAVRKAVKRYVFADPDDKNGIIATSGLTDLSRCINDTPVDNYAELVEKVGKMPESSKVVSIELGEKKQANLDNYRKRITPFFEKSPGFYAHYGFDHKYDHAVWGSDRKSTSSYNMMESESKIYLKDGEIWKTFSTKESRYSYGREKHYEKKEDSYIGKKLTEEEYKNYLVSIYYGVLENGLKVPLGELVNEDYNY